MNRRLEALLRRYPYTSLLVVAAVSVPALWLFGRWYGVKDGPGTAAWEYAAGLLVGGGWIAKWSRK